MKFPFEVVITLPDKFLAPSPGAHPDRTPDAVESLLQTALDNEIQKFAPVGAWWKVRPLARRGRPAPKVSA